MLDDVTVEVAVEDTVEVAALRETRGDDGLGPGLSPGLGPGLGVGLLADGCRAGERGADQPRHERGGRKQGGCSRSWPPECAPRDVFL
ncbi:hypothetical protein GCM10020001_069140 [Nonomuraea salmonea]